MQFKEEEEIHNILIGLNNTRGLLWIDMIEHILFDKEKKEKSLSRNVKLKSTEEIVNYVLVLDYLIDYLKHQYELVDFEIVTLLKKYLITCHTVKFEKLNGPIASWIISSENIVKMNKETLELEFAKIFLWLMKNHIQKWNLSHLSFQRKIGKQEKNNTVILNKQIGKWIENTNNQDLKILFSFRNPQTEQKWHQTIPQIKKYLEEHISNF